MHIKYLSEYTCSFSAAAFVCPVRYDPTAVALIEGFLVLYPPDSVAVSVLSTDFPIPLSSRFQTLPLFNKFPSTLIFIRSLAE